MRLPALIAVLCLAACTPARAAAPQPPVRHVFTIMLENKDYDRTFGPQPGAPYLGKDLVSRGTLLTQYYATGHLSLDNYLTMISGQAPNPETQADCQFFRDVTPGVIAGDGQALGSGCVYPKAVATLADQLDAAGFTWRGYMEDMGADPQREAATCAHPPLNSRDPTQDATELDQYATRHNPFAYFHSIIDEQARCDARVVPLDLLAEDLRRTETTPNYAFITPDLCHDGHDEPCADGSAGGYKGIDEFLRAWVPKITAAPAFRADGLLIVTFDEAEDDSSACCDEPKGFNTPAPGGLSGGPGGGRIGAVLLGPYARAGATVGTPINHYGYLRSIEDLFGLPRLGYAAQEGLATFQDAGALSAVATASPALPAAACGAGAALAAARVRPRGRRLSVLLPRATGTPVDADVLRFGRRRGVQAHLHRHSSSFSWSGRGARDGVYGLRLRAGGGVHAFGLQRSGGRFRSLGAYDLGLPCRPIRRFALAGPTFRGRRLPAVVRLAQGTAGRLTLRAAGRVVDRRRVRGGRRTTLRLRTRGGRAAVRLVVRRGGRRVAAAELRSRRR